ncbi:MAG: dephospho-CoA kinase [Phycisphaerales bacterium]
MFDARPHIAFVFTQMWRWFVFGLVLWGALRWMGMLWNQDPLNWGANAVLGAIGLRWLAGLWDWSVRRHVLTESRVVAQSGIFRTVLTDIPLRRVQHLMMVRPVAERFFGIGSIGVTSAGTGGVDLVWRGVEHPNEVLDLIREQVDRMSVHGSGKQVTPVIGIVGGIGSGKSSVAKEFESLGCVVSDSDQSVHEIMEDPKVIAQMVEWWGKRVLSADGTIDRRRVAEIVFENEFDRRRLEGLIHPLVHQKRREMVEGAVSRGVAGVIIDAPLLFEAGVDAECDAVVFVDTPKNIRQSRVEQSRGWSEEELEKREKTQLGLEHKRKRSDYVVANSGSPDELHRGVARVLASIQKDLQNRSIG